MHPRAGAAVQRRHQAVAFEAPGKLDPGAVRARRRDVEPAQFDQRRQEVGRLHHFVGPVPGEVAGCRDQPRDPRHLVVERYVVLADLSVFAEWHAVVGHDDHDGLVPQLVVIEPVEKPPEVTIDVGNLAPVQVDDLLAVRRRHPAGVGTRRDRQEPLPRPLAVARQRFVGRSQPGLVTLEGVEPQEEGLAAGPGTRRQPVEGAIDDRLDAHRRRTVGRRPAAQPPVSVGVPSPPVVGPLGGDPRLGKRSEPAVRSGVAGGSPQLAGELLERVEATDRGRHRHGTGYR